MKTDFRWVALGVSLLSLVIASGCTQQRANADEVPVAAPPPPALIAAAVAAAADAKPAESKPAEPPVTPSAALAAPRPTDAVAETKSPAAAAPAAGTNAVEATMLESLQVTPALAEVIKLIQAGVGEDVLMAYITNSTEVFSIGSNEILYLHDLGAPPGVITTLIQTDIVRRQAAGSAKPLPPGVALNTPATNIFTPKATPQPAAATQDAASAPAGVETVAVTTPEPSAPEGEIPVVYAPPVPQQPVSVTHFYTELAPYGSWVDVPGYGYCWRPTVAVWNASWRPYADGGRWLWTDHGWYWYSDYSWGWAPFHYGRWSCPPGVGWVWTPDTHWGPAWVSWRYTRNHCGWAPLPPSAHFVAGHGFYHNSLSVGISFDFGLSDHHYVFVPTSRFCDRRPINHRLTARHAHSVFKESTVVNNYVTVNNTKIVNQGVGVERVASATRGNIRQVALKGTSEIRSTTTRRETLAPDGATLTVARPELAAPAARPSARPGSTFRPGAQRETRDSSAVTSPSGGLASGAPAAIGADRVRPGRGRASAPPAEASRSVTETPASPASPAVARFQRPNMVPTSRAAVRSEAVVPPDSSAGRSPTLDGPARRAVVTVVPPANPRSSVAGAPPANSGRPASDRQRPQSPRQAAPQPEPAPQTPNAFRPAPPRPESGQVNVAPTAPRGSMARAPEPAQPRYTAPAQPSRPAPVPSAPPPSPRQYSPPAPRSESVRPSAPAPAPARSYTPPARSSSAGSAPPASSRSSNGDNGGRRNSR